MVPGHAIGEQSLLFGPLVSPSVGWREQQRHWPQVTIIADSIAGHWPGAHINTISAEPRLVVSTEQLSAVTSMARAPGKSRTSSPGQIPLQLERQGRSTPQPHRQCHKTTQSRRPGTLAVCSKESKLNLSVAKALLSKRSALSRNLSCRSRSTCQTKCHASDDRCFDVANVHIDSSLF